MSEYPQRYAARSGTVSRNRAGRRVSISTEGPRFCREECEEGICSPGCGVKPEDRTTTDSAGCAEPLYVHTECPDCASLRARLAAAERERDEARHDGEQACDHVTAALQDYNEAKERAEKSEAQNATLTAEIAALRLALASIGAIDPGRMGDYAAIETAQRLSRAVLATPSKSAECRQAMKAVCEAANQLLTDCFYTVPNAHRSKLAGSMRALMTALEALDATH